MKRREIVFCLCDKRQVTLNKTSRARHKMISSARIPKHNICHFIPLLIVEYSGSRGMAMEEKSISYTFN